MIDDFAKRYLHTDLREAREAVLRKLDGLSEHDIRPDLAQRGKDMWATEHESRAEITARYQRVRVHAVVHVLTGTSRHAGHADILREQLDGAVEMDPATLARRGQDATFWANRRTEVERAARAAAARESN
ncbi:DinB family protein [Saccharothrix mutabilis subsp. mutabilis]|uniref:DinB family protein n=1 Tax=Saccharothrix mutabilis subsp. mutabilis TaxID=66855 RepID=A0ABP3DI65_9PSEU